MPPRNKVGITTEKAMETEGLILKLDAQVCKLLVILLHYFEILI